MKTMSTCPTDPAETADLYGLGRLSAEQAAAFEEHYVSCPQCLDALECVRDLIAELKLGPDSEGSFNHRK